MKKLTVILPFLNEGDEVYNTVQNLRETSNNDIDIVLINDNSTDGYDYSSISQEFETIFIKHTERKGVAASREEGIDKSETDFFILMDAHMRFYQNDWVQIITEQLEKDRRCLFCCQTIILRKDQKGNINKEKNPGNQSFGAYVDFSDNNILNAKWNLYHPEGKEEIFDIPCVLGATYACNKSYWQKIKRTSRITLIRPGRNPYQSESMAGRRFLQINIPPDGRTYIPGRIAISQKVGRLHIQSII